MPHYTLTDGETLKNKLGAHSHNELEAREVDFVQAREAEHTLQQIIERTFDAGHLKAIHRHLFQDVYEWAGRTRDEKVRLSDGTIATEPLLYRPGGKPFLVGAQIREGLDQIGDTLRNADYLRGLPRSEFAFRAASILAGINTIHPFRDGNGRTQRLFLRELAAEAGHTLDFRVVSREGMIQASIAAHENDDIRSMHRMLDEISNPNRIAALSTAIAFLAGMNFPWNDHYFATMEAGHAAEVTIAGISGQHFMARTGSAILIGQRSDLPDANITSGQRTQVFPSQWPEPSLAEGE